MISHRNLTASIDALHEAWQWTPEDKLLHLLPLFHVHGLVVRLSLEGSICQCLYSLDA